HHGGGCPAGRHGTGGVTMTTHQLTATGPGRRDPAPRINRTRSTGSDRAVEASTHVLLVVWTLIIAVPLLWTLMTSFKTTEEYLANPLSLPSSLHWGNYVNAWQTAGIGRAFLNSVIVVG